MKIHAEGEVQLRLVGVRYGVPMLRFTGAGVSLEMYGKFSDGLLDMIQAEMVGQSFDIEIEPIIEE